jgi:hypothetical protein
MSARTEPGGTKELRGPLDVVEWPSTLTARVVGPGARPSLHGYDVEDDLAAHYAFGEVALLALAGEAPSREAGRAFDVAMCFAAPVPVDEAPTHAAVVARVCMASASQIQAVAMIGLAEQARASLEGLRSFLEALGGVLRELPPAARATSDAERASVERLRRALRGTIDVPALALDVGRTAALVATLHACGLRTMDRIEGALAWARLPATLAEALATPAGSHRQYPVHLPEIVYTEESP